MIFSNHQSAEHAYNVMFPDNMNLKEPRKFADGTIKIINIIDLYTLYHSVRYVNVPDIIQSDN